MRLNTNNSNSYPVISVTNHDSDVEYGDETAKKSRSRSKRSSAVVGERKPVANDFENQQNAIAIDIGVSPSTEEEDERIAREYTKKYGNDVNRVRGDVKPDEVDSEDIVVNVERGVNVAAVVTETAEGGGCGPPVPESVSAPRAPTSSGGAAPPHEAEQSSRSPSMNRVSSREQLISNRMDACDTGPGGDSPVVDHEPLHRFVFLFLFACD